MADRIPTPAEIATLSDAELRLLAQRLGVTDTHVARVTEAVRRATSRLVGANLPSLALVTAVREATQRAIRREMTKVTRELIRERQREEFGGDEDTPERWISVMDGKECEDCNARHGHVQTHSEWEADGLPGSNNTLCDGHCRCDLMPNSMFEEWSGRATEGQLAGLPSEADAHSGPGDVQVTVDLEVG